LGCALELAEMDVGGSEKPKLGGAESIERLVRREA
jgi:hypothetical protein